MRWTRSPSVPSWPIDVIFFGPPLSAGCDGHRALAFDAVQPGYAAFADLFLGQLGYTGTLVCIGPKTTHMGAIRRLYERIRARRDDFGLRLIHHSYATVTGAGIHAIQAQVCRAMVLRVGCRIRGRPGGLSRSAP